VSAGSDDRHRLLDRRRRSDGLEYDVRAPAVGRVAHSGHGVARIDVDRDICSERDRLVQPVTAPVRHHDSTCAAQPHREERQQPDRARAHDHYPIQQVNGGDVHGVHRDGERLDQCSLLERQRLGEWRDERLRDADAFRVRAVEVHAEPAPPLADVPISGQARFAGPAREDGSEGHAFTLPDGRNALADELHDAARLVPHHHPRRAAARSAHVAVDVGAADAGRTDRDHDLPRSRVRVEPVA
jgi:hypothetical protein